MPELKTNAAEVAYQAYRNRIGAKDPITGAPIPVWGEANEETREAWRAAVQSIVEPGEVRGRWYASAHRGVAYLILVERWKDWEDFFRDAEPGEPSSIVPRFALAVPDNVIITGFIG